MRLSDFSARFTGRTTKVTVAFAKDCRSHSEFLLAYFAIGQQAIRFAHLAFGKLFRKRAICLRGFAEHHHTGSLFVESVNNGEGGPAWFPVAQPLVYPLAGEWAG